MTLLYYVTCSCTWWQQTSLGWHLAFRLFGLLSWDIASYVEYFMLERFFADQLYFWL